MNKLEIQAQEILLIAKTIFEISENSNPNAIFKNNIFYPQEDGGVIVKKNYDKTDSSYYFETPNINGAIIKKQNGAYYIKACVKYLNADNREMWFAKIRIEEKFGEILLRGDWGGSWQSNDYEDIDFLKKPNFDLPIALNSMQNYLTDIYNQLSKNNELSVDYEPAWVKELKKYNN